MTAVEHYAARIDAVARQRARIHGRPWPGDRWTGANARRFRVDPRRKPDATLAAIAAYVKASDTVVDVGGGAGRLGLPLALRCTEVVNVDPSAGMRAEFEDCREEAGITNARFVSGDWLDVENVTGDVAIAANVVYFVREIGRFVEHLNRAIRRRVLITVWSVAPSFQTAAIFGVAYGETQEQVPSLRELLPVLWELGILPDVQVLPKGDTLAPLPSREGAIAWALNRLREEDDAMVQARIASHFDELFEPSPGGYLPRDRPHVRELLITWER